jgi:hypothetical protein
MRTWVMCATVAAVGLVVPAVAAAERKTWPCGAPAPWTTVERWEPDGVPASANDVVIVCPAANGPPSMEADTTIAGIDLCAPHRRRPAGARSRPASASAARSAPGTRCRNG